MQLDARLTEPLADVDAAALRYEQAGYAGAWVAETKYDPFLPVLAAARATERIQLGTSIAVAFARNPMTIAVTANDLHRASRGRFVLGLGTQVRAHVERRYSMPWSAPAERMREYVLAIRAIWRSWATGERLHGRFYRHDLMTPFFCPEPNPYGTPKIFLAGVGPKMTEVAGAVADGFFCHAFTTEKYVREVTIPSLTSARLRAGGEMSGYEIYAPLFIVTGADEAQQAGAARATKRRIAFYASTPAYRRVLEMYGWEDLQPELSALARDDRWGDMEHLISDRMLAEFAIVAEPERVAPAIQARFGGIFTRASLYLTEVTEPEIVDTIVRGVASL